MKLKKKKIWNYILSFLLIAAGLCSMFVYQSSTEKKVQSQAISLLQDSAEEEAKAFLREMDSQTAHLRVYANLLSTHVELTPETITKRMDSVMTFENCRRLFYADVSGHVSTDSQVIYDVSGQDFFRDALAGGTSICCIGEKSFDDTDAHLVISAPVVRDGSVLGVVFFTYDSAIFDSLVSNADERFSDILLLDGSGNLISCGPTDMQTAEEVLTALSAGCAADGGSWEGFLQNAAESGGSLPFPMGYETKYALYQPAGINDWVIVDVLSASAVGFSANEIVQSGYLLIGILCAIFFVVIVFIFYSFRRETRFEEMEEDYRNQLSIYRSFPIGGVFRFALDEHFTLLYANDKLYQMIDYTPEEIKERFSMHCMEFILPENRALARETLDSALAMNSPYADGVTRIITGNGCIKYLRISGEFTHENDMLVLSGVAVDITGQKKTENALAEEKEALRVSEERYRIALQNTSVNIWEYDMRNHCIHQGIGKGRVRGLDEVLHDVPESMISGGFVAPDSVEAFRAIFRKLDDGAPSAEGIFHVQTPDRSGLMYEYVRYTTIFSGDGRPLKAIAVSEDITERINAVHKYENESNFRRAIVKDVCASAIVNLSTGTMESLDLSNSSLQERLSLMTPDELMRWIADHIEGDEEIMHKLHSYSTQSLIQSYEAGQDQLSCVVLGRFAAGEPRWYRMEIRLLSSPTDQSLFAFLYLRDIDDEKREKDALELQAHTDPLTGVYNVSTAREIIDEYLNGPGQHQMSAFFMLDLDNFKEINDRMSHAEGDRVLISLAQELHRQFRETDLIARIGGDEFIVFLKNVPSLQFVSSKASTLCEALQYTHSNDNVSVHISCSAGVALCHNGEKTYQDLYREADAALYQAKNSGKSRYCLASDSGNLSGEAGEDTPVAALMARNNTVQLSALLQYMEGGVVLLEASDPMRVLYVSPSYYISTGVPQNSLHDFQDIIQLVDERDRPAFSDSLRRGAESRQVLDITYRVVLAEGTGWHHLRAVHIPYQGAEAPVMIAVVTDISEWQRSAELLAEDRKKLSLALEQTDLRIWNYDRITHALSPDGEDTLIYEDFPACFIRNDWVHTDSLEPFKAFLQQMESPARNGQAVVKMRHVTPDYAWYSISFINTFDEYGGWQKTIGVTHQLPYIDAQLAWLEQERFLQKALRSSLLATMRVDLNTRMAESLVCCDGKNFNFPSSENIPYLSIINYVAEIVVESADLEAIHRQFLPETLIADYENGRRWISFDFRAKTDSGKIRWCATSVNLITDPVSGHLLAFGYLRMIDARKRWENTLPQKATYDARICLYDARTTQAMLSHLLEVYCGTHKECALALLEIRGLSRIENDLGYSTVNNVLFAVGRLCTILMDEHSVVGIYKDNRLVFFLPDLSSEEPLRQQINSLLSALQGLRRKVFPNLDLDFLLGCAISPCSSASYETLCCHALDALGEIGELSLGQDTAFQIDSTLMRPEAPSLNNAATPESGAAWSIDSADAAAHKLVTEWMRRIIYSSSAADCANHLLPLLGDYYKANRVFTLLVSEDQQRFTLSDEWCTDNIQPLGSKYSNLPVASYPGVLEAIKSRATVTASSAGYNAVTIITPLQNDQKALGLIVIEAPAEHQESIAILTTLAEYWRQAYSGKAFISASGAAYYLDALTGLNNRNKYNEAFTACSKSEPASLGIAFADLNGLASINTQLGSTYGDEMILFAAKCFEEAFGHESVYRISGDEFVALLEDITYERFGNECDRVKALFEERYENGISIGYAWADTDIKPKSMEEHAKTIMKLCKQDYYERQMRAGVLQRPEVLDRLLQEIAEGRYQMFLQPKIRICDGTLCGAEALVRYRGPEMDLVSPAAFISTFEMQNIIRHVDLFILEEAAKLLRQWMDAKQPLIPIAVNFSRKTFLDRTSLLAASEIVGRYDIPLSLLEIEITESVADVERSTLANFCRRYNEKGFRLALDDFGSEYSSLSVLSAIHFDVLKLDKSLVNDITVNQVSRIVVQNCMSLCKQLGTVTVAEGVETGEQLELLSKMGCDVAQGYYFNKPLPPADFSELYCKPSLPKPPQRKSPYKAPSPALPV